MEVDVERMTVWADDRCAELRDTIGSRRPASRPPRMNRRRARARGSTRSVPQQRLRSLDHLLLAYVGADGYPEVVPVQIEGAGPDGIRLTSERLLPPGGRRAGMLAHSYRPKLIGLAARQHTGWLTVDEDGALYAPHTESGFRAPANKTALLLANGLLAKRGLRKARRAAARDQLRRSEPGGQRVSEPRLGQVSHPGHISVGPNQHGGGSSDRPEYRKLPRTDVFGVDQLNPIRPRSDVEAAGLTEVEQHRPGIVQQGEDPQRAVGGDQVEIGHAASEQRVSLAEVVMNVQTEHHRGESSARLVRP